jgi:NitT/TauT family transport system substrate-binding protein
MTMLRCRLFKWIAAALLCGSTAAVVAQSAAPASLRPVKMMSSLPTLTVAAPFLMKSRGFDKAHGLDVEILQAGGSSSLQVDAVLSGNVAFATPGTATAMQAIREGANLRILGAIANNQIAAVISNKALAKAGVSPSAPIADRIRAMKGMIIATNPVGATYYQMLRAYLKQYGLDPDNDVRLVGIAESSALISGIEQGRFDAIVTASGIVEQAISLKAGVLWFSGARGDTPNSDKSMVCVLVARADTVEKDPKLVDAMRAALGDALKALRDDRVETGRHLRDQYFQKLDPAVWEMVWNGATEAYPPALTFPRKAFDFWVDIDPKGAASYKNVDYQKITYARAQAQ